MPKRPPDPSLNAPALGEASASWVSAAVVTTEPDATPSALPTEIPQDWHQLAEAKGFSITARIKDRFHLELRCKTCAQTHVSKIYTLRTAQPTCPGCMADRRVTEAQEAGLVWLRGDPDNPHYSFYRAPCGHELRRQHELILRVGQGRTGVRCTICLAQSDAEKAALRGWVLIGTDPQGRAGYRLYGHCCGARQSITRQNMQTGRFDCAECGPGWAAAPSWIYVMAFTLSSGRQVVKLGFARDPDSRLNWQLQQDRDMPCSILRRLPVASGHVAVRIEKRLHAHLRRRHPTDVVDPAHYQRQIRVRSEVYEASLTPEIMRLLDEVGRQGSAG
ncbi:hypothetical protein SAMN05519105_4040 [Rhodobacter sp. 24-YEA-8]|nr:hypothetical protein SAMN05519105_4040 [Rhodobacter sp. 24-YEA-8]